MVLLYLITSAWFDYIFREVTKTNTETAMDPGHKEDLNSVEGDGNGDGILDESDIDRVIDLQDNGGMIWCW